MKECENCPSPSIYRFLTLPGVGIFAQIWRKDEDQALSRKGDYLIDQFYAAENLDLAENTVKDFSVKWRIPKELKEGDYYFFFFVNSNKRFSLAGTPLVAFYQAAAYDFRVTNDSADNGVEFDKNNISINGKSYVYRQPAPEVTPDDGKITVALPLSNLSPENQPVKVKYNLYGWGPEDPAGLISSKEESKNIDSGEKINLEYAFSPTETNSAYNLEIKATASDSVSVANVRFVVKGMSRGIFRFLGQAQDSQGKMLPVFCLRNATWSESFYGKVKIAALDNKGKPLQNFEKEGEMLPEDRCFTIEDESWLKEGKTVQLQGEIYDGSGRLVDKRTVNLVSGEEVSSAEKLGQNIAESLFTPKLKVILVILLIVLLGAGGYLILLRSKKEE